MQLKIEPKLDGCISKTLISIVNYVEILRIMLKYFETNYKYQLKYRIKKYRDRLKSLILNRYLIVTNFPVSPITSD